MKYRLERNSKLCLSVLLQEIMVISPVLVLLKPKYSNCKFLG
jgi:hypothetical protein